MTDERYNEIDQMKPEELQAVLEAEYREYTAARYLRISKAEIPELMAHIETAQQGMLPIWATGFRKLDEKLDGGFLGGNLVVIGAISSLGKTTFALQIADQIAKKGKDVLIFSLEMSKNELNAKRISRTTYTLPDAGVQYNRETKQYERKGKPEQSYRLTMGDILRGRVGVLGDERRKLFDRAVNEILKLNDHLYLIRDNDIDLDKIGDIVQAHEDATGHKPLVILDYLQILKAREDSRTADKRLLTDDDVNRLKDLAVKHDIPVLAVSSFNRNSYLESVSMGSFKESGTIEYSSDTLIALQYSGMQYKKHWFTDDRGRKKIVYESKTEHDTRVRLLVEKMDEAGAAGNFLPIDVVVLKNRGVSKGKILFEFCPKYNVFCEKPDQNTHAYDWNEDSERDDFKDLETDEKTPFDNLGSV